MITMSWDESLVELSYTRRLIVSISYIRTLIEIMMYMHHVLEYWYSNTIRPIQNLFLHSMQENVK